MVTAREKPQDQLRASSRPGPHTDPTPVCSPAGPEPPQSRSHRTSSLGTDKKEGEIVERGADRVSPSAAQGRKHRRTMQTSVLRPPLPTLGRSLTLLATLWGLFLWGTLPARLNWLPVWLQGKRRNGAEPCRDGTPRDSQPKMRFSGRGEISAWHDSHKPWSLYLLKRRCSAGPLPREPEFCPKTCRS